MAEHLAAWLLWQTLELGAHIGGLFGGEDDATPKNEPEWIRHWKFFYSLQSQCYSSKMLTNTVSLPSGLLWPLAAVSWGQGQLRPRLESLPADAAYGSEFRHPIGRGFLRGAPGLPIGTP